MEENPLGRPMTQQEVADALGISRQMVSRIEKTAMNKIRRNLRDNPKLMSEIQSLLEESHGT